MLELMYIIIYVISSLHKTTSIPQDCKFDKNNSMFYTCSRITKCPWYIHTSHFNCENNFIAKIDNILYKTSNCYFSDNGRIQECYQPISIAKFNKVCIGNSSCPVTDDKRYISDLARRYCNVDANQEALIEYKWTCVNVLVENLQEMSFDSKNTIYITNKGLNILLLQIIPNTDTTKTLTIQVPVSQYSKITFTNNGECKLSMIGEPFKHQKENTYVTKAKKRKNITLISTNCQNKMYTKWLLYVDLNLSDTGDEVIQGNIPTNIIIIICCVLALVAIVVMAIVICCILKRKKPLTTSTSPKPLIQINDDALRSCNGSLTYATIPHDYDPGYELAEPYYGDQPRRSIPGSSTDRLNTTFDSVKYSKRSEISKPGDSKSTGACSKAISNRKYSSNMKHAKSANILNGGSSPYISSPISPYDNPHIQFKKRSNSASNVLEVDPDTFPINQPIIAMLPDGRTMSVTVLSNDSNYGDQQEDQNFDINNSSRCSSKSDVSHASHVSNASSSNGKEAEKKKLLTRDLSVVQEASLEHQNQF